MTQRVLVSVEEGADVDDVVEQLDGLGGAQVHRPEPELPGVCVVELADDVDAREWVRRAAAVEGVEAAEPDALRWDLGPGA
ncbi:S8 family serine peptidase [Thalassiella azotivora]